VVLSYGRLPLHFEKNEGQTDQQVEYLARGRGYTLFLTPAGSVLVLQKPHRAGSGNESTSGRVLRMSLLGANPRAAVEGRDELPGKSHYFIGNDRKSWRTNVSHYARVEYEHVYPGVSLAYYGNEGTLEYDFIVEPHADPRQIRLRIEGADEVRLDTEGNLVLTLPAGQVVERAPVAYQQIDGVRKPIVARFVLTGAREVGFEVGAYEADRPLVLDPALLYSTYLGGSDLDEGFGIAADSSGNAYVTGFTKSANFPTANSLQVANGGGQDAFVAKFNVAGGLVYSTYLGGSEYEQGKGIAVDASGNAYVVGWTSSTNFPTVNPLQASNSGGTDIFVSKLNASGSALIYSTYLGGSGGDNIDYGSGLAVDASGSAYVTGLTGSTDFPTVAPIQPTNLGIINAFVSKLNAAGSGLVYSTYLGGSSNDQGASIAVDTLGNAYVTGLAGSTNFPTVNPIQAANGGSFDAFVAKLNAAGSALVYSTYLGGNSVDVGDGIAVDASGNAYVTGIEGSTNFPTANAFQASNAGGNDAFVTKINAAGSALVYSTYLGGSGCCDFAYGIAVNGSGQAYVTGYTNSTDFPTFNAVQGSYGGGNIDVFLTQFSATGSALVHSTYLGGDGHDEGRAIAVDAVGNAYLTGRTTTNFPTANPFQPAPGGDDDAFVSLIGTAFADLSIAKTDGQTTAGAGSPVTYTITVGNAGPFPATGATVTDTFPASLTGVTWTCTASAGSSCGAASGTGNINRTVNLLVGGTATFTATATLNVAATGTLVNTATVTPPAGVSDPVPGNNTATDTDTIVPAAQLSITKTDGQATASPSQAITYTIVATNAGPSPVTGATVTDTPPASLLTPTWTCVGAGGGTCAASGSGSINDTVNLPVGATVTYTLMGTVSPNPTTLSNTATITPPASVNDPNLANNTATDTDVLTCFSETVVVPDGRLTQTTVASGATVYFAASVRIGNAYSVEFRNLTGTASPGTMTVFSGDNGCSGASTVVVNDTSNIDPAGPSGIARQSFTAAGTDTFFRVRLVNTTGGPVTITFGWSDTTLYSPAWSTNGTFDTFYSLQNTTGVAISGTLTLYDTAGAVQSTLAVTVPAQQTSSTNTGAMGVTRNRTGTARFVHSGPPGAIVAETAIANFTISPAYVQPVKFLPVREAR
jgi:uncharacterized repeat protein (TIGR01451 family)